MLRVYVHPIVIWALKRLRILALQELELFLYVYLRWSWHFLYCLNVYVGRSAERLMPLFEICSAVLSHILNARIMIHQHGGGWLPRVRPRIFRIFGRLPVLHGISERVHSLGLRRFLITLIVRTTFVLHEVTRLPSVHSVLVQGADHRRQLIENLLSES